MSKRARGRVAFVCAGVAPLVAWLDSARCAEEPQPAAPDEAAALQEVVVTSQKRTENLQNVPIAVTAIQGDVLSSSGVDAQKNLATLTPNVAVDVNANFVAPYIRGVGTAYANPGLEPSVATYIDDIYVSRADAGMLSFGEIERVEVLKGPQGTLYGRNTTGGAIRVITRDAPKEFRAHASITGGNYGRVGGDAGVGGPLGSNFRASVYGFYDSDDGWVKNITPAAPKLENRDLKMVRGKLVWDATDQLSVRFSADYSEKTDREGQAFLPLYPGTVETGVALGGLTSTDSRVYSGDYPKNKSTYQGFHSKQGGGELRIDYNLDWATFSSITGYRYVWFHGLADLDTTTVDLIQANTIAEATNDFSEELQAVSTGSGPLGWVAGLYYFHENAGHDFGVGGLAISGATGVPNGFTGGDGAISIKSIAPYGQITYAVTPEWELLAGVRYTSEKKTLQKNIFYLTTVDANYAPVGTPLLSVPATNTGAEVKPTAVSPKVGVNWRPTQGVMAYFSYTKGFKSGGFNLPQPSPAPVQQVGNEYLEAYELGLKTELGNVRLNAAAFHYKGKNLQVQITDQNSGITSVKNAASSKTDGVEADLAWAAVRGIELDAGIGYQNAKFQDFPGGQIITPGVVGTVATIANLSGRQLPQAPKWSGYLRPVLTQPLPGTLGMLDANLVVSYTGSFFWTPDNVLREPGKTIINANLGWKSADGHYAVNLFGTNLADRQYSTHEAQFATGGWRVPGTPREYGVRGSVSY